jgi:hypothetical protein
VPEERRRRGMKTEGANETDVREEIASRFLAVLGYKVEGKQ